MVDMYKIDRRGGGGLGGSKNRSLGQTLNIYFWHANMFAQSWQKMVGFNLLNFLV